MSPPYVNKRHVYLGDSVTELHCGQVWNPRVRPDRLTRVPITEEELADRSVVLENVCGNCKRLVLSKSDRSRKRVGVAESDALRDA